MPLLGILPALAQNIGFMFFIISLSNTIISLSLLYTLSFITGTMIYGLLAGLLSDQGFLKIIIGVLITIMPSTNLIDYFSHLAILLTQDNIGVISGLEPMSFWKMMNESNIYQLPLWVNMLLSIISLVVYVLLAIVIDSTRKSANYPTRRSYLVKESRNALLQNPQSF